MLVWRVGRNCPSASTATIAWGETCPPRSMVPSATMPWKRVAAAVFPARHTRAGSSTRPSTSSATAARAPARWESSKSPSSTLSRSIRSRGSLSMSMHPPSTSRMRGMCAARARGGIAARSAPKTKRSGVPAAHSAGPPPGEDSRRLRSESAWCSASASREEYPAPAASPLSTSLAPARRAGSSSRAASCSRAWKTSRAEPSRLPLPVETRLVSTASSCCRTAGCALPRMSSSAKPLARAATCGALSGRFSPAPPACSSPDSTTSALACCAEVPFLPYAFSSASSSQSSTGMHAPSICTAVTTRCAVAVSSSPTAETSTGRRSGRWGAALCPARIRRVWSCRAAADRLSTVHSLAPWISRGMSCGRMPRAIFRQPTAGHPL
mmetsp:Transcript_29245/g.93542  ORF Transcript_29245/g.93542 Transcript_29245/m.93542 type:complete len:381 (+) Transcript_29245:199-1341(+)